jgi:hypothetical protein
MRRELMQGNWLPARHGVLLKYHAAHGKNELYDTTGRIFLLEPALLATKTRRIRAMGDDPRFTSVEANLRYFKARYEAILTARPDAPAGSDAARVRYYEYITTQHARRAASSSRP